MKNDVSAVVIYFLTAILYKNAGSEGDFGLSIADIQEVTNF
jgi:hypothetical protein